MGSLLLRCWDLCDRCYVTCYYAATTLLRSLGSLLRYLLLRCWDLWDRCYVTCYYCQLITVHALQRWRLKAKKARLKFFQVFKSTNQHGTVVKSPFLGTMCTPMSTVSGPAGCFCSCSYSCSCSLVCSCFCSCSCCCCCCPRVRLRPRLKLMMVVFTTSLPWRAPPCYRPGLAGICGLQKPLDGGKGANVTSETLDFSHMFCMSLVRCPTYCWHGGFCTKHTETLHFYISCCCCCFCFSFCSCFCSCSCSSSCSCVCFCFCCGCVTIFSSLTRSPLLRPGSAD